MVCTSLILFFLSVCFRRSRQPLPTSRISIGLPTKSKLRVSMDNSNRKNMMNGPTSRSVDASPVKPARPGTDTPFFNNIRSPRKQYFTIHPEWVSENLSVQKMSLKSGSQQQEVNSRRSATLGREGVQGTSGGGDTRRPRRCKSAPPPRTRNPITWERSDISGR